MRLGLYGGTFDPIHHGHLILARDAIEALKLDRLIFIPNTISPHKQNRVPAPAELRVEMVRAAIAGEAAFEVDDSELLREPPSYTIDTLVEIKNRFPNAEVFYLIGEDNIAELHTWRQIDEVTQLAQLVVLTRGVEKPAHLHPEIKRRIDISATEIRRRVADGQSIRYLVPDSVLKIIAHQKLYQETAS